MSVSHSILFFFSFWRNLLTLNSEKPIVQCEAVKNEKSLLNKWCDPSPCCVLTQHPASAGNTSHQWCQARASVCLSLTWFVVWLFCCSVLQEASCRRPVNEIKKKGRVFPASTDRLTRSIPMGWTAVCPAHTAAQVQPPFYLSEYVTENSYTYTQSFVGVESLRTVLLPRMVCLLAN